MTTSEFTAFLINLLSTAQENAHDNPHDFALDYDLSPDLAEDLGTFALEHITEFQQHTILFGEFTLTVRRA